MFYVEEQLVVDQFVDLFGDLSQGVLRVTRVHVYNLVQLLVDELYCVRGDVFYRWLFSFLLLTLCDCSTSAERKWLIHFVGDLLELGKGLGEV